MVILGLKKTHWSSIFCIAVWYVSRRLQNKKILDSAIKYVLWVWVEWKKRNFNNLHKTLVDSILTISPRDSDFTCTTCYPLPQRVEDPIVFLCY